jgi:hypothetical protein
LPISFKFKECPLEVSLKAPLFQKFRREDKGKTSSWIEIEFFQPNLSLWNLAS